MLRRTQGAMSYRCRTEPDLNNEVKGNPMTGGSALLDPRPLPALLLCDFEDDLEFNRHAQGKAGNAD